MLEAGIDLNNVRYLTFEGGGGKGLVYLGAIAALERTLNPDLRPRASDSSGQDLGPAPGALMTLTDRSLFDINTHPDKRPFAGVSGASAGAITALFLAMGMSSLDIDNEINTIIAEGLTLGNPARRVPASRFEQFFDNPLPYWNLTVDPTPGEKQFENKFTADAPLSLLTAEVAWKGIASEIADDPTLLQLTLIRRLFLTHREREKDKDYMLYFQSLLANRGLFTLRKVRDYFRGVIRRRLINRFGNWSTMFPDIPADPGLLTFRQFLKVTGVDLVVMGSNSSQGSSLPFSAGATPDFPVAEAVMLSMSIPVLFKPLYVDTVVHSNPKDLRVRDINAFYKGLWVDGGMLNNYPRHVFKYIKTVEGLTYRDDGRLLPVALPWRLFDVRMPDLRPPSLQVLGFTLSSFGPSEVDDPFAKRDTLVSLKYAGRLLEAMLKASTENQILGYEDELMTIALDPGAISVVDFAGPDLDEQRGYTATAAAKRKSIRDAFARTRTRIRYSK